MGLNSKVKISSAQYPITKFSTISEWSLAVEKWISQAQEKKSNCIVFPEYGSMELTSLLEPSLQGDLRGQLEYFKKYHEEFVDFFKKQAVQKKIYILAPSIPYYSEPGLPTNRAYFFSPTGQIDYQEKHMMTRFEHEEWGIRSGENIFKIFETDFGLVGIQICYDIEFAWGSAMMANVGAEIIFAPSCTESLRGCHRVHIGARARALENQFYVVVAQTVGDAEWSPAVDKNVGFAAVYGPSDNFFPEDGILQKGIINNACLIHTELDLALIRKVRAAGQVFNFKDNHQVDWFRLIESKYQVQKAIFS